jgi:mannitol/fructose-specific phosphotransferase system IIA component
MMMKLRFRRRSACMIGTAIAVPGGTAQARTAVRAVIASVVSVVELFVDLVKPQRRHLVPLPVPLVASRSSRRRAG